MTRLGLTLAFYLCILIAGVWAQNLKPHNDSSCHLLLPEHCHCRTAINYTSDAQRNACKYFYPISFIFIGCAFSLMLVQIIVIFCIFAPALKRRSITSALNIEEVRCEHCDHRLELLLHQLDEERKYACISCKLEHRIAIALGSLVCEILSLAAFEICWLFALRNFLTLLSASVVIFFFLLSAWSVGDGFFRYYCYMNGEDPNNRSSSFSCFSSCFPSFGTYISQNENGAELQFGNGGDLILPDHFPLPISPIPLRSGEQVVFTSEPPRPARLRAFAFHSSACWLILLTVPICVSALEFQYGESVLLSLLLCPPLLFCCFLTTLNLVPSLRAYLVLTNERLIILYPAMFGRHKALSYPLARIRSAAIVTIASPLHLQLLVFRSRSHLPNGALLVSRAAALADALQPLLPETDGGSRRILTLDHAIETSAQCARCCTFAFPAISVVLFSIPPVCLLLTNAEVFVATLPLWFFIYVMWLIRTVIRNATTTSVRFPSSLRPSRRKSTSPKPQQLQEADKEEEEKEADSAFKKKHFEEESDGVDGANAIELSPRRTKQEEDTEDDSHLHSPSENVSLLRNTSP